MALFPALKALFSGDPVKAGNLLLTPQDVVDASTDVDSRWEKFLASQVQAGKETNEAAARTLQNIMATDVSTGAIYNDRSTSPLEGFVEGANEGLQAEQTFISKGINGVGGFVWGAIPLWVWLGAGLGIFIWLGGLDLVRGMIRRKASA